MNEHPESVVRRRATLATFAMLGPLDQAILIGYLAATLGIGFWSAHKSKESSRSFFVHRRRASLVGCRPDHGRGGDERRTMPGK